MKRTLISGYRYNFCVMVSDVRVVQRLSGCLFWTVWKAVDRIESDMPSRDLMQTNCRGCYLKMEHLWTLALLSDYLIWSFLQCPSDIKKCTFSECRTNGGKSAFKITSLWVTVKISNPAAIASKSPIHHCMDLPRKIIFWAAEILLSWSYAFLEMLCFGLGAAKFTASHFGYRSTGCWSRKHW